ncbi:hypothetical protein ymoll0001_7960 [Yersinia mollaretii ATCC 43969]|uniref:Uncharacterized protein n=1 Tax=Yersinia mollaretii (strain ATCC 43969 / DSM 18520 / CIP 103324 / CNY 7263 / WAIP 204) TaxID=349967 RepID=A0ABP2EGY1_YERMW|nr:hypothetical protein ymoll0001_7960 [Yersinia mollaretii ATCC 43969]
MTELPLHDPIRHFTHKSHIKEFTDGMKTLSSQSRGALTIFMGRF